MRPRLLSLLMTAALLAAADQASAQTFQALLWGRVADVKTGIPGVSVTALNVATGVPRHTVTNKAGLYAFPAMDPGCYTITATIAGYETYERDQVCLSTATPVSLDLPLDMGSKSAVINGHAPVRIATASTGMLIDEQMMDVTPNAYRNIYALKRLVPAMIR